MADQRSFEELVADVPGFTVEAHLPRLRELHDQIDSEGPFVAHSTRTLFEARRPT